MDFLDILEPIEYLENFIFNFCFKDYFMKRLFLIVFVLCFVFCALLQAQTKCETIAEIRALDSGTECVYEGYALATFYDGYNGIMIQDETGVLLLKNSKCSYGNTSIVAPGMEVSNVKGKFMTGNNMIARIEVSNSDVSKMDVYEEAESVLMPKVVDFDTYMNDIDGYEGVVVRLTNVNIRTLEGTTTSQIYSLTTDKVLKLSFSNAPGAQVPLRADLLGFLSADWSGNIFQVANVDAIEAYSYRSINNLKVGVTKNVGKEYELADTFTVTNVVNMPSNKVVYIQEEGSSYNFGLRVVLSSDVDVKIGDRVTGFGGVFEPYVKGDTQKSATLIQSASKSVVVVSSGAQSRVLSNYIYTLTDNDMQNAYMYDGSLFSLSGGVVTKTVNGYSYVVENENGQGRKEIALRVANVDDLSAYVGKECPVQGVLDVAATYPENQLTIVLRSTKDFLESNVQFNSVAELIAAGEPAGTSVTYELVNPVLVTYKFTKGGGDDAVVSYFAIVQDATEGIVLSLGAEDLLNVAVGDSVVGIKGVYSNMRGLTTDILDVTEALRKDVVVRNSNNSIVPIEVTFAQLLADKQQYSNRVVVVNNVKNNRVEHTNNDGSLWLEYYFTQCEDRLDYTLDADGKPYFTFYADMSITGVVDDRVIGGYYSVWPLSQAHIVNLNPTEVDYLVDDVNIYSNDNTLYVEAEVGVNISVFSLVGQCLYSATSVDDLTMIDNIVERCVIVKVNNSIYKVIM